VNVKASKDGCVCPTLKRSTDYDADRLHQTFALVAYSLCSYTKITPPSLVDLCILTTLHKHVA